MIRFALFGAGFIGRVHAQNVAHHPRATLTAVYDVNTQASGELAGRLGARVAARPGDIWAADDVDAVIIASSTNTHAELLGAAIRAGKPVYCEKPIDLDISRVKAVVREAYRSAVPILVGFSRRFDANHLGVRDAVRSGQVGTPELLLLTSRGPQPPPIEYVRVSGGQFRDQTIHFFDLACWITGQTPTEVYAAGTAMTDPAIGEAGDVDTSMLILRLPSGALVHIDNSRRCAYGYDESIEVFGSAGMVQSNRQPRREVSLYRGEVVTSDSLHPGWFERLEATFPRALDALIRALEGEPSEYPTLMDGLRAQLIAEAAAESLRTNRPVRVEDWRPEAERTAEQESVSPAGLE